MVSGFTDTGVIDESRAGEIVGCSTGRLGEFGGAERLAESDSNTVSRPVLLLPCEDCGPKSNGVAMTTIAVRTSAMRNRLSIALGRLDHGTGSKPPA